MESQDASSFDLDKLPTVLKVKEVSKILRIPLTRTYELIDKGKIPCVRLGRSIRVPKSVIADMLDMGKSINGD